MAGPESHRRTRLVSVNHRVNRVKIIQSAGPSRHGFAECDGTDKTVQYDWGPPEERVTVIIITRDTVNGRPLGSGRPTRLDLTRREADASPFIFPPDP